MTSRPYVLLSCAASIDGYIDDATGSRLLLSNDADFDRGGTMHTQFLAAGLADELHLVIAPFFVGDAQAPRFVHDGTFPWNPRHRARLAEVTQIEDVVLLRSALSDRYDGQCDTSGRGDAVTTASGALTGAYGDGYLAELRADWPE